MTDTFLRHKLHSFFTEHNAADIHFSETPVRESLTDIYCTESEKLPLFFRNDEPVVETWQPVIVFGPPGALKSSFYAGCTDFVKEPWEPEELFLRIRRAVGSRFNRFRWDTFLFYPYHAAAGEHTVALSRQEYTILYILTRKRGDIIHRSTLEYALWDRERENSRAVDMHISSIRKKLAHLTMLSSIETHYSLLTIHGEGYILELTDQPFLS